MQEKIQKKTFVFEKIVSELFMLNCIYEADNASHRLWICEETVLGFCVSLKETFSNAITFTVINK